MKLASHRFLWHWPEGLPVASLRPWLLKQLRAEGDPLRWAITGLKQAPSGGGRLVQVEAVLVSAAPTQ